MSLESKLNDWEGYVLANWPKICHGLGKDLIDNKERVNVGNSISGIIKSINNLQPYQYMVITESLLPFNKSDDRRVMTGSQFWNIADLHDIGRITAKDEINPQESFLEKIKDNLSFVSSLNKDNYKLIGRRGLSFVPSNTGRWVLPISDIVRGFDLASTILKFDIPIEYRFRDNGYTIDFDMPSTIKKLQYNSANGRVVGTSRSVHGFGDNFVVFDYEGSSNFFKIKTPKGQIQKLKLIDSSAILGSVLREAYCKNQDYNISPMGNELSSDHVNFAFPVPTIDAMWFYNKLVNNVLVIKPHFNKDGEYQGRKIGELNLSHIEVLMNFKMFYDGVDSMFREDTDLKSLNTIVSGANFAKYANMTGDYEKRGATFSLK